MAFAGIGAYAMVEWAPTGSIEGLLFGALLAIPFGVLMALPALRLRGLYFALASVAFARGMELLFFTQPEVFGDVAVGSHVARPEVLGVDMADQLTFLVATSVLFAITAIGLIALRRSRYGRRLLALRDSEAATTTVGLDVRVIKLAVFSLSAMLGAVAGALLAIQRGTPSAGDFTMFAGLGLTLFLVVGGVALVTGALFGGMLQFVLALVAIEWVSPFTRLLEAAGPAFAAIRLSRNPYGAAGTIGTNLSKLLPWRRRTASVGTTTTPSPAPTHQPGKQG
jgi:branched-chain amino acid transport system permease protein